MLPEKLSTDLTSLNPDEDRLAVVVDMVVGANGELQSSDIYRARVRNHAKLAYRSVAGWLDGSAAMPQALAAVPGLAENLRDQDRIAHRLKNLRQVHGALSLETTRARPVFEDDNLSGLDVEKKNRATEIIEDFMIAANGVAARYLAAKNFPSIRRVVRTPKRWDRIVELAATHGVTLPANPDSVALDAFLVKQQAADPTRFPDLSLAVVKLLGAGEYVAERPGADVPGTLRSLGQGLHPFHRPESPLPGSDHAAFVEGRHRRRAAPYSYDDLVLLARHVTEEEDAANKVERQVGKSAAAMLLESRIGEQFEALVTGASEKGTWVRLLAIPVEGRVVRGFEGLDVGEQIRVQLVSVDVERGFIDFASVT